MTLTGTAALFKRMCDQDYDNGFPPGANMGETVSIARTPAVSATAIITSYTSSEIASAGPGVIKAEDLKIRVRKSATLTSLTTADVITRGGNGYRMVNVVESRIGGEIYEWICQGRY